MADRVHTTRRAVLKAAPAAILTGAIPAAAASPAIIVLFEEWRSLCAAFPVGGDDEALNAFTAAEDHVVGLIAAQPARTLRDLAMKLVAAQDFEAHLNATRAEAATLAEVA